MHNLNLVKAGYCCPPSHQSSIHLQSLSRRIRLVPSRGPNRALSSPRARRHSENKKKRNQNTEKRSHEAACLHPAPRRMHLERHVCPPSCGEAAPCSLFLALRITGSPLVLRCPPCCNIWALHGHSNSFFPPPTSWQGGAPEGKRQQTFQMSSEQSEAAAILQQRLQSARFIWPRGFYQKHSRRKFSSGS